MLVALATVGFVRWNPGEGDEPLRRARRPRVRDHRGALALSHPGALAGFVGALACWVLAWLWTSARRRARGEPPPRDDPAVKKSREAVIDGL